MRYLLVGLGNLGRRRRALLGGRCVATVDPFNDGAEYREAARVPADRYDAAVLSVPNEPKVGLLEQFLTRGKHVLVDKPVLLRAEEGSRLAALSEASGAIWYTSYNHRFEPLVVAAKERVEAGVLGELYHARMLYGNGTVGDVVGSWREGGVGVLEDLGSHLLDLCAYLLDYGGRPFEPVVVNRHESTAPDQAIMRSADGKVVLETSYVSWKNTFAIELWGSRGSLHLRGLRKWGPCELIVRERVLPSGVPRETRLTDAGPDETWLRDFAEFESRVAAGRCSLENDRWITDVLLDVASQEG